MLCHFIMKQFSLFFLCGTGQCRCKLQIDTHTKKSNFENKKVKSALAGFRKSLNITGTHIQGHLSKGWRPQSAKE